MHVLAHPPACLIAIAALAGCAAAGTPDPAPPAGPGALTQRLILVWHQDLADGPQARAAFEAEASRVAGVPVQEVSAVSARVRALALTCPDAPACAEGRRRLRADPRVVELVPDQQRRSHSP